MRKGLTEVVFILDRSGSMSGLEADTIGGFNSLINKQKEEEGEAFISTVLFDDEMEVLYDRVDVHKIEPMNDKQYYVRGCTALLDAVGGAIHHISDAYDEGYDSVYDDDDYDWDRYLEDDDYANGVDDAMDELDW